MSSMKRKYERAIIRHQCYKRDGNVKGFRAEWREYDNSKTALRIEHTNANGGSTAVRIKPKHTKSINRTKAVKQFISNARKKDMTAVKI